MTRSSSTRTPSSRSCCARNKAYADAAVQELREAAITRVPHLPLLDDAWSLRHNLSAYVATYVALARDLHCPLLTLDAGILGAPDVGVTVIRPGA